MAAELAIIAKLQDEASSGIRALRGEIEGIEPSTGMAAKGFAALQTVGAAALTALAAAAVAVGGAIVSSIGAASEFQDSVTILAIAAKGAGESFDSMRAAAMAVGADTSLVGVNAAGAAEAMTILYKAGMTTGEVFGDLNGYLSGHVELSGALRAAIDGAAASELSMEQAAMLAATSLATFGSEMMTTSERAEFVNTAMNSFVQTADASMASVADLAAAMQNLGPSAAQFGFTLQDTNTALALLSTRGIMGAEAGTALGSMFKHLMSATPPVTGALNELGVSLYNTDGTMRSMPQIVADLSQALYGLNETTVITGGRTAEQNHQLELAKKSYDQATDAIYKHNAGLKTLTDSQLQKYVQQQSAANAEIQRLEAVTGTATTAVSRLTEEQRNQYIQTLAGSYGMKAMAVLLMEGVDGWTAMEKAIASAATIQEVAAARTQTFSGAMEALSGVVETIRIGIGSAFLPALTALARAFADMAAGALPHIVGAFEALGGALAMFFDAIIGGANPVTAFADAVAHLAEALGMPAEQAALLKAQIEGVLQAIVAVVGPIVQAITSFVSWKDVLVLLGIAIASVIIPALFGIVQVAAPIIAVVGGLLLAVAALRNAWEADFLGIRSAVEGAVEVFGRFVEAIRVLTDEDARVQAMAAALAGLPEALRPLAEAVAAFINTLRDGGSLVDAFRAGLETLRQAIFDWAGASSWSELGSMILDKIAEAFSNLGDRAATAAANILNWISTAVNSIDWSAVGTAIVNGVAAAITAVVGLLAMAGTAIASFFNSFFTNESLATAGTNIVTAIGNAISGAASGIATGLDSIRQAIFDWAGADSWGEVGQTIIDRIAEAFRNLGDRVAEIEASIFNWIADAINGIDWHDVGETIINGIVAAVTAVVGLLVTAGTAIVNYFIGFFTNDEIGPAGENIVTALGDAISEFASGISDGLASVRDAIFDWAGVEDWSGVGEKILEMIGNAIAEADAFISDKMEAVRDAIFDWAGEEDWGGVAEKIIEMIGNAIGAAASSVADAMGALEQAIFDWAGEEDWGGVAEKIAEEIGIALGEAKDNLTTGLADWLTTISDWVQDTDWSEVGLNIVLSAIEGLGEFANEVGTKVSDWLDDLTAEIEKINWYDAGYQIAYGVVEELGAFADLVGDKIEEWKTSLADEAEKIDWKAAADAILKGITDKLTDISTFLTTTLPGWIEQFKAQTEGMAWNEVALVILAGIVSKLFGIDAVPGHDLGATISSWKTAISNAVQAKIAEFNAIGADVVAGVANGISAGVSAIAQAIQGVIDGAIAAWNAGLDRHSPAGVMIPIGYDISAGVAVGIIQGVGTVVGAIQQLASQIEVEGAKAFGEAMTALAEGLAAGLSAILDLSAFPGVGGSFLDNLRTVVDMLAQMVAEVNRANVYSAEALELLATFVEVATAIADLIAPLIMALTEISHFQPIGLEAFTSAMQQLATYLSIAVRSLMAANVYGAETLALLGTFVDVAADIANLILPLIAAITEIGRFQLIDPSTFVAAIEQLAEYLAIAVRNLIAANIYGLGTLERLGTFVEVAADIADLLLPLITAVSQIALFRLVDPYTFVAAIEQLAEYLAIAVRNLIAANTFGQTTLELLGVFVDVAGGIADLLLPLVTAVTEIARFQLIDPTSFVAAIEQLAEYLAIVVRNLVAANQYGQATLEGLSALLDVVQQIADTVAPFLAALVDINAFGTVDLWFFHEGIAQLWYTMLMVVEKVRQLATVGEETLAQMEGFLEVVQAMADTIGPFIESLFELNAFGNVDLWFFHEGLNQLAYVMLMVVAALNEANDFGTAALEGVQQFAETAGAIAELIGPMIEGLISINALDGTMNEVAYHATLFRNGVRGLVEALASAAMLFTTGTLQHVQQFAETAGAIVEIIVPAVEGLLIIGTLTGDVADVAYQAIYFRNGLRAVVDALASAAVLFTAALLNQVQLFAETAGKIMELIVPAIEGFALIGTLTGEVNNIGLQAVLLRNGLRIVVDAIASAALLFTAGLLEHAQLFAETAGEIVDLVADAIEALGLLVGYVAASGLEAASAAFAADLTTVIRTLVDALTQAGLMANEAIVKAGELAGELSDVLGLVEDGVEALVALATYVPSANLLPTSQQFAADLALVINQVVNGLVQAGILANGAIVAAGNLAGGLGDVLGMVEDGVGALVELANYVPNAGLGALAQRFAADLALVINQVVQALVQAGVLANQAVVQAGELAGGLSNILSVVAEGLEAIRALADYVPASGIQARAAAFATDLATVILSIVNGLVQAGLLANQAVAAAGELAARLGDLLGVVSQGIEAIKAIAEYKGVEGLAEKVTRFTADLVAVATILATQLTLAANAIGAATIDAARAFAAAVTALAAEVQAAMQGLAQLAGMATPNLVPVLNYVTTVADQIRVAFTVAGDIGQAVAYAAAFRANLTQLVVEVQGAVAQLNALAGTGTSGSVGAALANIAASLQNTEGQFAGAGAALANALITALTAGVNAGQGQVLGAAVGVLDATRSAGEGAAREFGRVGDAIIDAIASAIQSGQGQVVAAVVQVVNAAIAAGLAEARKAATVGQQLIQSALAEVNAGRGQLDSAGSAAGNALIDGMSRAVSAGRSRVVNAIIETVRAAIAAAKAALGIASPSRVAIDIMSNFMNTAAGTVDKLGSTLEGSMRRAIGDAAAAASAGLGTLSYAPQLAGAGLPAGRSAALADRVATATVGSPARRALGFETGSHNQVVIYGDVVLPGVADPRSFLEELDALRVSR